jgi:DNA polymerase V
MSQKPFFEAIITQTAMALPFFESVSAGFPSPATDYMDAKLDLNELCIKNPSATFFFRVSGDSMQGVGISDDDILIVDRSLKPKIRDIVIAVFEKEFLVKRFCRQGRFIVLMSENPNYTPIIIEEETDFQVWGVVTKVIHNVKY